MIYYYVLYYIMLSCRTPLHFAASMGSVEMVKLLLSVGADASLTSINGDTAYDIAVQEDRKDIIPLIPNLKNSEL
jgi:ankyrin repeat protein